MTSNIPSSEAAPSLPAYPAPFTADEWFAIAASISMAGVYGQEESIGADETHPAYTYAVIGLSALRKALGTAAYEHLKQRFDEMAKAEQAAAKAATEEPAE